MPTVLSKPDGEGGTFKPQHAGDKENLVESGTHPELPRSNESSMGQILDRLRIRQHMHSIHQYLTTIHSALTGQQVVPDVPDFDIPNFDEPHTSQEDLELRNKRDVETEGLQKDRPDRVQPPPLSPDADKLNGINLMNGQVTLRIANWRDPDPEFIVLNNPTGNPKHELEVTAGPDIAELDFKIPVDFPGGLSGFMGTLQAFFIAPEMIGIVSMETGSAAASRESNKPKKGRYHIKWTSPWETFGCRVSWMKAKAKSKTVKFKFVNTRNASPEEQVLVVVNEGNEYYQNVSKNDPNIFGQWMAWPARVWLHAQHVLSQFDGIENNLFNKLPVDKNVHGPARKKRKGKKRKSRKGLPESSMADATEEPEGTEAHEGPETAEASEVPNASEETEATEVSETPEAPEVSKELGVTMNENLIIDSPVVLSPEHSELGDMEVDSAGGEDWLSKTLSELAIDTEESKKWQRHKRASDSAGAIDVKEAYQFTHRRGYSIQGLHTNIPLSNFLSNVAPAPDQDHTVNTSLSSVTSASLTAPSTSFETAQSNISPVVSLPSSTPSQFFTPMSTPLGKSEGDMEPKVEPTDSEKTSDQQCPIVPQKDGIPLQCPVSQTGDELYISEAKHHADDSEKILEIVPPREQSPDPVILGLIENLQKHTVSPPMADPPLTTRTSCDRTTTDNDKAELVTEQLESDGTLKTSNESQAKPETKQPRSDDTAKDSNEAQPKPETEQPKSDGPAKTRKKAKAKAKAKAKRFSEQSKSDGSVEKSNEAQAKLVLSEKPNSDGSVKTSNEARTKLVSEQPKSDSPAKTSNEAQAELVSEQPKSDGTVNDGNQAETEADLRAQSKKNENRRKKNERKKRKGCQRRDEARDRPLDSIPEHQASTNFSSGHGVEGHPPSPPEASNDLEQPPKAMQYGGVGAPYSQPALDLSTVAVQCAKPGCGIICQYNGVSVTCPKCGPYSLIRYCSKPHLWEDVKAHWTDCSIHTIRQPCMASSISPDALVGPPMLPCFHGWDTPERHRQAVWFSSASNRGDYFVFTDWTDIMKAGDDPASHSRLRCSPRVAHTVRFEDAKEKDRFRRCLAICLFSALEHPALVDYLYRLIRDWMRAHSLWASGNTMDSMLRYQLGREMGGDIHPSRVGMRHACETEWTGVNRRHCGDPVCVREQPPALLGNQCVGFGFWRMCEYLESKHWILRAHRATHPSVSNVVARTCGVGYPEVLPEDRRLFRRGEGWDGVGTGPLELEWP